MIYYTLYAIRYTLSVMGITLLTAGFACASGTSYVETLFLEGRYEKAVEEIDKITDRTSRDRDELFYLKGSSELKMARFAAARDSFDKVITRYPDSPRAFEASVGIADSYYLEGALDMAVKACEDTLKKFPSDKNLPLIYYRLSDWYKKKGMDNLAVYYSQKSIESGQLSFEARQPKKIEEPAVIRDVKGKNYFSIQVGSFKTRQNAQRLKANLERAGYDSFIEVLNDAGNYMYRVKIGRFNTLQEANLESARLRKKHYSTKVCYSNLP